MKLNKFLFIGFSFLMLAGCNGYKVKVDLPADRLQAIKEQVKTYKQEIADYIPEDNNATIPWQAMIDLSRAYEEMGELGRAIKVYEDVIAKGEKTKAILNNLGRLYEQTEQYDKAVVMYQRISDEYFDHDYLYDITWAYIRAGKRKEAEKYFNAWQLEFQKTDEQIQQAIKKLREAEKAEQ